MKVGFGWLGGFCIVCIFFNAFNKIVILKKYLCLHTLQLQTASKSKHFMLCSHWPRKGQRRQCQDMVQQTLPLSPYKRNKSESKGSCPLQGRMHMTGRPGACSRICPVHLHIWRKEHITGKASVLQAPLHHRSQYLFPAYSWQTLIHSFLF